MKSMQDLELEGKYIRIFPGDSVRKWGLIQDVTTEGIMVTITFVDRGSWSSSDGWIVGTRRFLNWGKLDFYICDSQEANTGRC